MQRRRRHVERTRTYYSWCTCVKRFVFRCRLKVGDRLAKSHVSRQRVPSRWSHCDRKVLPPGDASSRPGRWCRNEFEGRRHRSDAKVGEGAPIQREAPEIWIFWSCPSTFVGSKSTISRFGESFRDGQHSWVSFLFAVLLLTVPPVPSHL